MKIIITGVTGMVGEGVLLECLKHPEITGILVVGRRPYSMQHPKVEELIVPDFFQVEEFSDRLKGYDACFYCAGVSSIGKNESDYTRITYDTTLHFAKTLLSCNQDMVFDFVTGSHTDSTESGKMMWARVKGRTENALMKLPFRGQYNFRPGVMEPIKGQKNVRWFFKPFIWVIPHLFPRKSLTLEEVGKAMINTVTKGYPKQVLEIDDIRKLAHL